MAETNWILNLIDRVTAPLKSVMSQVTSTSDAVEDLTEAIVFNEQEAKEALENELAHRDDVRAKIKAQEKAIKELTDQQSNAAPGNAWVSFQKAISEANVVLDGFNKELKESEEDLKDINEQLEAAKNKTSNWVATAVGFNQVSELIGKVSSALDFTVAINKSQNNIQRMTGVSGDALEELTGKVHMIGKVFGESDDKVAQAANALKKSMNVSYEDALNLIEKGYEKGANLNGDMLANMQKFGPQMKEMGIGAEQMVALMAKAGKEGIVGDDALKSLDDANNSLKERTKPTIEALEGIGIEVKDLADISSFEAVQMISKAMDGATTQAKALVLKNVFKKSGKDAGSGWIEGIGSVDMNIENIPSVVDAGTGLQKFLASVETGFANTFGNAGVYVKQFADMAVPLNGVVGIIMTLSKVTWLQNVAQKALNITTGIFNAIAMAGPWGWIAIAIGGVILAVGYLADKFEWAAGIVGGVQNSFMDFGQVILDMVLLPFKMALAAAGALGGAIFNLLKGNFGEAWNSTKGIVDPLKELGKTVGTAVNSYAEGSDAKKEEFRKKKEAEKAAADKALHENEKDEPPPKLGLTPPEEEESKKKKKGSDGMSISGAGGTKSITMNLEIKNYFNAVKGDARQFANEIAGHINDRLRDALVTQ